MRRYSFLLLLLVILAGCAGRQAEVQDNDQALALPEVRKVTFQGNETFGARALRKAIASKPRPLLPPWKRGETYNRPTLEADLKRLRKYYFDRGFLTAKARIENVKEDNEKNTREITIAIEEGPETLVETVRVVGHVPPELPPEDKILADLALRSGARLTKADFNRSQVQLALLMQDAGYARARVVPQTEVDFDAHQAVMTFALYPGDLTAFGEVTVTGRERIKERAIRRQLRFKPGDTYSADKLTKTSDAIYSIGMFRSVTPRGANFEAEDEPLDIEIVVQERKPRTLEASVGFSTVAGPRFRLAWTHWNFFRGGEQLTLEGLGSFIAQEARATLRLPFFFAQRTTFSQTQSFRNEYLFSDTLGIIDPQPDFDLFTVSAVSRVERELGDFWTAAVGLDLSYNDYYGVDEDAETDEGTEDSLLVIQFAELTYDTSDDFLNPTRGLLLRGSFDHSTTSVLSDVNFAKLRLEGRHYLPIWWRMIFATRLVMGTIQPYGETDTGEILRNIRFFAGGPGSVRGFRINRLGPLDEDNDPIGGNSLIEGSAELRFPIVGQLWGALFVDFGNVFPKSFTFHFDDLRYAVGPGIRYMTPIGPIRLDIGFIMDPRSNEDTARLEFSIGQAF